MSSLGRRIYAQIRKIEFLYLIRQYVADTAYRQNRKAMRKAARPKSQIKEEMSALRKYWHCFPYQYIRYKLYDKDISIEEMKKYIPPYHFYNHHLPKMQEGIDLGKYENKIFQSKAFSERGVATAPLVALVRRGALSAPDGTPLTMAELLGKLPDGGKLFFKPANGLGGMGIIIVKRCGEEFTVGGERVTPDGVMHRLGRGSYVVQFGIRQRADLMGINASSVNTLRIITQFLPTDSEPRLCLCILRMGRGGKEVDNSHVGGLTIHVDTSDGHFIGDAITEHGETFSQHPDTGYVFGGKGIAGWNEVRSFVLDTAAKFPELRELGWDIALTESGPIAVEMNLGFGIVIQCTVGGARDALRVYPEK